MLGTYLVTTGYTLAIIGGVLLFINTPPDVGGTHALMVPKTDGNQVEEERDDIGSRRRWNRVGFALLTIGAILQLAGYWADRFSARPS